MSGVGSGVGVGVAVETVGACHRTVAAASVCGVAAHAGSAASAVTAPQMTVAERITRGIPPEYALERRARASHARETGIGGRAGSGAARH
jgi:hypothetical protein